MPYTSCSCCSPVSSELIFVDPPGISVDSLSSDASIEDLVYHWLVNFLFLGDSLIAENGGDWLVCWGMCVTP